jgi:hypothetical protein
MPGYLRDVRPEPRPIRKASARGVWPTHVHACANCTGREHAYGARGYCSRCYRLIKLLEDVKCWNLTNRKTLRRIPKSGTRPLLPGRELITDGYSAEQFETYRQNCIDKLKRRLDLFRRREEIRRLEVPVSGLDLEYKFAELLRLVRPRADYPRIATYLAHHFDGTQRRVIYALLEEIVEQTPWRGIL